MQYIVNWGYRSFTAPNGQVFGSAVHISGRTLAVLALALDADPSPYTSLPNVQVMDAAQFAVAFVAGGTN